MSSPIISKPELGPVTFDLRGLAKDDIEAVSDILREVKGATDRIAKAARRWVELSDEVRSKVIEGTPKSLQSIWDRLDRIGNGSLHPLLYSAYGHGANLLGKLPVAEQEKYLTEKIPVSIQRSGRTDIQRIGVEDLGPKLRLQVFKSAGGTVQIRTVQEQRAWLAEQERKREAREAADTGLTRIVRPGRWKVEKNRLWLEKDKAAAGLTINDVKQMLRDLQM